MSPVILQIKGSENIFNPIFEDWDTEEELCKAWQVCTKIRDSLENGCRMENLSWRLWYLHQNMVKNKKISTKDFKKISSAKKQKLLEFEPTNEKTFQEIKNYIEKNQKKKDKLLTGKISIKSEPNAKDLSITPMDTDSLPLYNSDISLIDDSSLSLGLNNNLLNDKLFMDYLKIKNNGTNELETLGIPLNETYNQNSNLLLSSDTPSNDDFSNFSELMNRFPTNPNIPVPQPPNLHIPDMSIRTEMSEMYLNNKLGTRFNDVNNLYDETINNEDPAFNLLKLNGFQTSSPAISQQSSFKSTSFPNLLQTQTQKLDLFNSSTDSLNNSLSYSTNSIGDDNVSLSLMNQISSLNNLTSSNLSSYSDLTNSSNLTALNNFTSSSSDLLGLNNIANSSALGVLSDVTNPAALALDNTNYASSLLTNPSLLSTSLQSSTPLTNTTLIDSNKTPTNSTNASKTTLNNNTLLSAVQVKANGNSIFPMSTANNSSILASQNKTTSLPLNLFNNTTDSMIIPVTNLGNTAPTAATGTNDLASTTNNALGLNFNDLILKGMLKNPLTTPDASTVPKLNNSTPNNSNTKLSNDLLIPYDIQTTPSTNTDALKNIKKENITTPLSSTSTPNSKINDKINTPLKQEITTPVTNKKLNNKEKTTGSNSLTTQDVFNRLILTQYNIPHTNLSNEQVALVVEQLNNITNNTLGKTDGLKNKNGNAGTSIATSTSLLNSNQINLFDTQNAAAQFNKNEKNKEELNRLLESIKTTQANLLLNPNSQAQNSLLSSLITNPLYKNLQPSKSANGKLPIRADNVKIASADNRPLAKVTKADKAVKGKTKKTNNNSNGSNSSSTINSAITATPPTTILKSMPTTDKKNITATTTTTNITIPSNSQFQLQQQLQKKKPTTTNIISTPSSAVTTPTVTSASTTTTPTANKKKNASIYINQKSIDNLTTQHVKPVCANCGVNHTPLWRRSANDEILCNACGLYQKLHKIPRPKSIRQHAVRKDTQAMTEHETTECSNCHTTNTPLWRRDENGATLCNACGLYQKMHHSARPISMKTDLPRKRQRFDSIPSIPGITNPSLLTNPGLNGFLPYGNLCYPMNFGAIPGGSQFLYSPLGQATLSPALSDKSDKSSKSKKKSKSNQTPVPQKKMKLSAPSPTVVDKKK